MGRDGREDGMGWEGKGWIDDVRREWFGETIVGIWGPMRCLSPVRTLLSRHFVNNGRRRTPNKRGLINNRCVQWYLAKLTMKVVWVPKLVGGWAVE